MNADEKLCPDCGETVKALARKCRFCGYAFAPLPDTPAPIPPPSAPAPPAPVEIEGNEVLDLLSALVEKSLVIYEQDQNGQGRYRLLETVRQYGREKLEAGEEATALRRRHRDWYLALAEEAEPELSGSEQQIWLERLEVEHDNLRTALTWSIGEGKREKGKGKREEEAKQEEREDAPSFPSSLPSLPLLEAGLRLCGALSRFWTIRGHLGEGRAWCEAALEAEGASGRTAARAKILNGVGVLAWSQSDFAGARTYHEACLSIQREIGNKQGIAISLNNLGNAAWSQGDYTSARTYHEASLAIRQEIGDKRGIASSLNNLGLVAGDQSDFVSARAYYEASLAIRQEMGDKRGIAYALHNLGDVACYQGDYASARTYHEESLAIRHEIGDRQGIALSLHNLGDVARSQGDNAQARTYYEQSLPRFQEIGDRQGIAHSLLGLGTVACSEGHYTGARNSFAQSLLHFQEIGERRGIVNTLEGFAALATTQALAAMVPADTAAARKAETDQAVSSLRRAARLWGASQVLREALGAPLSPIEQQMQEPEIAAAQARLGKADWTAAWDEGRALTMEQTIEYALSSA